MGITKRCFFNDCSCHLWIFLWSIAKNLVIEHQKVVNNYVEKTFLSSITELIWIVSHKCMTDFDCMMVPHSSFSLFNKLDNSEQPIDWSWMLHSIGTGKAFITTWWFQTKNSLTHGSIKASMFFYCKFLSFLTKKLLIDIMKMNESSKDTSSKKELKIKKQNRNKETNIKIVVNHRKQ